MAVYIYLSFLIMKTAYLSQNTSAGVLNTVELTNRLQSAGSFDHACEGVIEQGIIDKHFPAIASVMASCFEYSHEECLNALKTKAADRQFPMPTEEWQHAEKSLHNYSFQKRNRVAIWLWKKLIADNTDGVYEGLVKLANHTPDSPHDRWWDVLNIITDFARKYKEQLFVLVAESLTYTDQHQLEQELDDGIKQLLEPTIDINSTDLVDDADPVTPGSYAKFIYKTQIAPNEPEGWKLNREWINRKLRNGIDPCEIIDDLQRKSNAHTDPEQKAKYDACNDWVLNDTLNLWQQPLPKGGLYSRAKQRTAYGSWTNPFEGRFALNIRLENADSPNTGRAYLVDRNLDEQLILEGLNNTVNRRHANDAVLAAMEQRNEKWRYNTRSCKLELNEKPVEAYEFDCIAEEYSQSMNINYPANTGKIVFKNVRRDNAYDPVKDIILKYHSDPTIKALPIDTFATKYLNCNHDHADRIGQIFWLTFMSRIMNPGCANRYLFLLLGAQGIGKTTIFDRIARLGVPHDKHSSIRYQVVVKPGQKLDDPNWAMQCQKATLVNFDELGKPTSSTALDTFKQYVTETQDDSRTYYTQQYEVTQRSYALVGSSNNTNFASDLTGNSRLLVLQSDQPENCPLDTAALEKDLPGLIKGAYQAFLEMRPDNELDKEDGRVCRFLSKEEADAIAQHTNQFAERSIYSSTAEAVLEKRSIVAPQELIELLDLSDRDAKENRFEIKKAMTACGWAEEVKQKWIPSKKAPKGGRSIRGCWYKKDAEINPSEVTPWMDRFYELKQNRNSY